MKHETVYVTKQEVADGEYRYYITGCDIDGEVEAEYGYSFTFASAINTAYAIAEKHGATVETEI